MCVSLNIKGAEWSLIRHRIRFSQRNQRREETTARIVPLNLALNPLIKFRLTVM